MSKKPTEDDVMKAVQEAIAPYTYYIRRRLVAAGFKVDAKQLFPYLAGLEAAGRIMRRNNDHNGFYGYMWVITDGRQG